MLLLSIAIFLWIAICEASYKGKKLWNVFICAFHYPPTPQGSGHTVLPDLLNGKSTSKCQRYRLAMILSYATATNGTALPMPFER